ncbi:MAG: hypothetical protein U9N49_04620 [Campylobacterota bacterium]|nr:hypothetical protein [Campylobacterota bacterium]
MINCAFLVVISSSVGFFLGAYIIKLDYKDAHKKHFEDKKDV